MDQKNSNIDLGPLPELIGYVLRRAQLVVFQDFFNAFAPFEISPAQFSVLIVIERNPGLTQSQVAAALGIKRTNFVGLLDELERRLLAERRQAARDKRSSASTMSSFKHVARSVCPPGPWLSPTRISASTSGAWSRVTMP